MDQKLDNNQFLGMIESPLGRIHILYTTEGIKALNFNEITLDNTIHKSDYQLFNKINNEIKEYFQRQLLTFSIPLLPEGTPFQKLVWNELLKIPFGTTCTYQELAIRLGGKEKTRAVATAVAKNPILILIPCHRVIGTNGKLTGFSAGLDRKRLLLGLEGNTMNE